MSECECSEDLRNAVGCLCATTPPTGCVVLPGYLPIADEFAAITGLTVDDASRVVDTNIVRGES